MSTSKAMGKHGINWKSEILLDLNYCDDLSMNVSKMNELLEVL